MLRHEDNELITRVGPGTPMGNLVREYWMPACRSASLIADGAAQRVRLVGENFVAYRVTDGSVGFIYEACPHRAASMALARNENNGLRCIFHGWKLDANGKVLECPAEPADTRDAFAARVKSRHFPVREAGGMLWVYLGKEATPPPFPEFEFNMLPDTQVCARRALVHYNWVQGIEAHIDASHVGILHSGARNIGRETTFNERDLRLLTDHAAPRTEMHVTNYGLREGALRDLGDGTYYARIREVVLPFFTFIPSSAEQPCSARATVPIDDEWDAEWYILYDTQKPLEQKRIDLLFEGSSGDPDNFASNLGSSANLWYQDREAMLKHWSGFPRSVPFEDFIITESMGANVDRSTEQLGRADVILVQVRRMLLDAVRDHMAGKPAPWNVSTQQYQRIRAVATTYPNATAWQDIDVLGEFQKQAAE